MSFCSSVPPNSWAILSIFRLYAYSCCIVVSTWIKLHLSGWNLNKHLLNQDAKQSKSLCSVCWSCGLVIFLKTFVSSANIYTFETILSARSFMYKTTVRQERLGPSWCVILYSIRFKFAYQSFVRDGVRCFHEVQIDNVYRLPSI